MQLKTILNQVERHRSFVYGKAQFTETSRGPAIEVEVRARANGRPVCSGCGRYRPGYDTLPVRRWEFVPLWGFLVFFVYAMRRVDCPRCGVKVEQVPWAQGKSSLTKEYQWFLAGWARRMSWKEVAISFSVSWDHVYNSVKHAVSFVVSISFLCG